MKIAIPMEEKSMSSSICVTFGRAPYFLIFDTDTEKETYIENLAAAAQGGAGIKAAQAMIDAGTEAVILPRLGQNAAGNIAYETNERAKEIFDRLYAKISEVMK